MDGNDRYKKIFSSRIGTYEKTNEISHVERQKLDLSPGQSKERRILLQGCKCQSRIREENLPNFASKLLWYRTLLENFLRLYAPQVRRGHFKRDRLIFFSRLINNKGSTTRIVC